jgi:membrane protein
VSARERIVAATAKGQAWAERQDKATFRGVAVGTWYRYRAVDGPLQSALLALYVLVAVLPALLVMEEYLDDDPAALSRELVHHFGLTAPTARVVQGVLSQTRSHELGSAVLAIAGALLFGLGFGRVLQLVHVRAWNLDLPRREIDQLRYGAVLCGVWGLIFVLLVQLAENTGHSVWIGLAFVPLWFVLLALFFVWAPRYLTHNLLEPRDLLPGAILTAAGLVALLIVSRYLMEFWVDLYARDYGGFGVVMALFFWIAFASTIIVVAASISPSLAERRTLRRAGATRPPTRATPDPGP